MRLVTVADRLRAVLRWRFTLIGVAVAFGIVALLVDSPQGAAGAAQPDQGVSVRGAEIASRQRPPRPERLNVCLKVAGGVVVDEAKALETVQAALTQLTQHQYWWRWDYKEAPVVDLNCDHQPVLLQPGVIVTRGTYLAFRHLPTEPVVQQPGQYQLYITVISDEEMERLFWGYTRDRADRRAETEEAICDGDACGEVARGLYIAPADAFDREFLIATLTKFLSLDREPGPGEPRTAAERKPTPLTIPDPGKPFTAAGGGPDSADLVVADFTVFPEPIVGGRDVMITYAVKNLGPARATDVRIFNQFPIGVRGRGLTVSQGGCAYEPRVVCDVGEILVGGQVVVTVDALADTTADGEGSYRVRVLGRQSDPNPSNNSGARVLMVNALPRMAVTLDASPKTVTAGQEITFTAIVTNPGPASLTDVKYGFGFSPDEIREVRTEPPCPGPTPVGGAVPAHHTCTLGQMASGESRSVTLVATARKAGAYQASVSAWPNERLEAVRRGRAGLLVNVDPSVDLAVRIEGPTGSVMSGDPIPYTVTVENRGTVPANRTEVLIPTLPNIPIILPDDGRTGGRFDPRPADAASPDQPPMASCARVSDTDILCYVRPLDAGAIARMTFSLVAGPAGTASLGASVKSQEGDFDLSNNVATPAQTTVVPRSCAPRLTPVVRADPGSPDRVRVWVEVATNASVPENRIGRVRIGATEAGNASSSDDPVNALIDRPELLDGRGPARSGRTGSFAIESGRLQRDSFFIRRANAGQAVRVPLTVEDDCGAWQTVLDFGAAPWGNSSGVEVAASPAGAVRVGDRVTYTTTVTNRGETGAAGAVAVGTLPPGLAFESATVSQGTCSGRAPVVCEPGRLEVGASVTMTIVARAGEAGTHAFTAYAATEAWDRPEENLATVQTEVAP